MHNGKYLLAAALTMSFCLHGSAQDLPVENIEVVKHFDARLVDAQKLPFYPRLPERDSTARAYTYDVSVVPPQIGYEAPQLRPLALRPEESPEVYHGLLRAGYGFPNAILGELDYHIDAEEAQVSVHAEHQSANDKDTPLKKYSHTGVDLNGSYVFAPALALDGEIGFTRSRFDYFGLKSGDNTSYIDEGNTFKIFDFGTHLTNAEVLPGDISYRVGFHLYNLQDDLATKETGTHFDLSARKIISGKHEAGVDASALLTRLRDTEGKRNQNNLEITPYFTLHGDIYAVRAGVKFAGEKDSSYIFPDAAIHVRIVGNTVGAYVKATGGLTTNSYRSLSSENPYIFPELDDAVLNTVHRDYIAGLKGQVRKINYQFEAGYTTFKNIALFEQGFFDYRRYQPIYDNGKLFRLEASMQTEFQDALTFGASVSKIFYDLDTEEKAWYKPGFEASILAVHHSMQNRLHITARLLVASGVPYPMSFDEKEKLKGLFDLGLGADYFITKNIGAFFQVHNLLGRKYEPYQFYEGYGVQGVAGILLRV